MSLRSVILGLLGAAFIAAACFFNDRYSGTDVLVGLHFPVSVFGALVVAGIFINPLLYKLRPAWRWTTREMATALVLTLVACGVPGMSLVQEFAPMLVMPAQHNLVSPGWRKHNVLSYAPGAMMPAGGKYDEEVVKGYLTGHRDRPFGLGDVPWAQWRGPLTTWVPLMILLAAATICLSLIVHRQWSDHERLRYPIAEVAGALSSQEPGRARGPVYRENLFWLALVIILAVRCIHASYRLTQADEKPMALNFTAIGSAFPNLSKIPGQKYVFGPIIYPAAIGFAFFLASDVSLSIGLSMYLHFALTGILIFTGATVQDDSFAGGVFTWQRFGSCLGIAFVIAQTGRRYYWQVLKAAFGARAQDQIDRYAVWACRFLVLAAAGAMALLISLGLDWPLAILVVLLILLLYLAIARFSAEGGLFFVTSLWQPAAVLSGLLGGLALGPKGVVMVGLVTMIFAHDPRDTLMPFVVNALKIGQNAGIKPGKLALPSVAVYVLALAVALPTTLFLSYKLGAGTAKRYEAENKTWAQLTFKATERVMTELDNRGRLDESLHLRGWERLTHMQPHKLFFTSAGIGLALVLVFSMLRLRYLWWPIHPIMFCVWGSQSMKALSASFLIGWAVKGALSRLGLLTSGRIVRVRALMIGMIAGDLLAGVIYMIIGAVYYAVTGLTPKEYYIFPH